MIKVNNNKKRRIKKATKTERWPINSFPHIYRAKGSVDNITNAEVKYITFVSREHS